MTSSLQTIFKMAVGFIDYFPKIVLFGDSLTQFSFCPNGFGSTIADHFQRKCDVLNRGFSGYTTKSDRLILRRLLKNDNHPPGSIVAAVILIGTNDSEDVNYEKTRNVPILKYMENLRNICGQFRGHGVPFDKQVLVTPPGVADEKWVDWCKIKGYTPAFKNEFIKPYCDACVKIGQELGIEVFNLSTEMQQEDNWQDMLSDGLHLSSRGHQFVSQRLIPILDRKLPNLEMVFPDWTDVHPQQPEKTLATFYE